jgi:hypothetical protein
MESAYLMLGQAIREVRHKNKLIQMMCDTEKFVAAAVSFLRGQSVLLRVYTVCCGTRRDRAGRRVANKIRFAQRTVWTSYDANCANSREQNATKNKFKSVEVSVNERITGVLGSF